MVSIGIWSDDNIQQLEGTIQLRKTPIKEREFNAHNRAIDELIQSGAVPRFIEFLHREDFPKLQFDAAWILTNIACGTSENTKVVIDHGAVPIFVELLSSSSNDLQEQAVLALSNIAADSIGCRDLVLSHGVLTPLLSHLNEQANLSMLRVTTWALSNFLWGKPKPPFEQVSPLLPALKRLIFSIDEEVMINACFALSYLSNYGTNDNIQSVIEAGVCGRLLELLMHPSPLVVTSALQTVGNIVTGDDMQTQVVINHGLLTCFLRLLTDNHDRSIKKEVCWTISNITAGNKEQKQAVIEAGLIAPMVDLFHNADAGIKNKIAWAIANATSGGTHEQIKYLASQGCIKPLCDLLVCSNPSIVSVCLEGLENFLKVGEAEKIIGDVNMYAKMIDDVEGLKKIENLQKHKEIYEKANKIIKTYWLEDETPLPNPSGGFNFWRRVWVGWGCRVGHSVLVLHDVCNEVLGWVSRNLLGRKYVAVAKNQ